MGFTSIFIWYCFRVDIVNAHFCWMRLHCSMFIVKQNYRQSHTHTHIRLKRKNSSYNDLSNFGVSRSNLCFATRLVGDCNGNTCLLAGSFSDSVLSGNKPDSIDQTTQLLKAIVSLLPPHPGINGSNEIVSDTDRHMPFVSFVADSLAKSSNFHFVTRSKSQSETFVVVYGDRRGTRIDSTNYLIPINMLNGSFSFNTRTKGIVCLRVCRWSV